MTINLQVLRHLNANFGYGTNREIARGIERPEPSVRRATRELVALGLLKSLGDWMGANDYGITKRGQNAARNGIV